VFVIAPGSFGKLPADKDGLPPKNPRTYLQGAFDGATSYVVKGNRGGNGVTLSVITRHSDQVFEVIGNSDGKGSQRPVWLCGQSFGSRSCVHLILGEVEMQKKMTTIPFEQHREVPAKGLILFGYPLMNSKGATAARANVLKELHRRKGSMPVLFVKGTKDKDYAEFTNLFHELHSSESSAWTLHSVPGGKHNPFEGPKQEVTKNNAETVDAIRAFVSKHSF